MGIIKKGVQLIKREEPRYEYCEKCRYGQICVTKSDRKEFKRLHKGHHRETVFEKFMRWFR